MKITASEAQHVNWSAMEESLVGNAGKQIQTAIKEAQHAFEELGPGQRKTIKINVGQITVARPRE